MTKLSNNFLLTGPATPAESTSGKKVAIIMSVGHKNIECYGQTLSARLALYLLTS